MPNTYNTLGTLFTAIANAIRAKRGTVATIVADDFPAEISAIETKLPTVPRGVPTISVTGAGVVTATVVQAGGTVEAGTESSGYILDTAAGGTVTPTTSQQLVVAEHKYTTGNIYVGAMPSGTEGTPTATKGAVANHAIDVTPSVTNVGGYISGGIRTGSPVTVTAAELVSGYKTINDNGVVDVTDYQYANVNVQAGALQWDVNVTPNEYGNYVTPDAGYYGIGEVQVNPIPSSYVGSAVPRRSSSDLTVSDNTVTAPAGYYENAATATVSGGGKAVQIVSGSGRVTTTNYTEVSGQTITVEKTGTYDVYWFGYRSSASGTNGSQLYIGSTAYGSPVTSFDATLLNCQNVHLSGVSLTAGQTIAVRARARSTSYYMYVANLTIIEQ